MRRVETERLWNRIAGFRNADCDIVLRKESVGQQTDDLCVAGLVQVWKQENINTAVYSGSMHQ